MPIYVYPQGPSAPISRLKRVDEFTSTVERVQLDTEQVPAQIGETIPLVFGKQVTFKNNSDEDVTVGGCWTDPRLVALSLDDGSVDLMYVLTQGRLVNLPVEDVKYGSTTVGEDSLEDVTFCMAYQQIPSCIQIDEGVPGAISTGPALSIDQSEENLAIYYTKTGTCTQITFEFVGTVIVSGNGPGILAQEHLVWAENGNEKVAVSGIQPVKLGTGINGGAYPNSFQDPPVRYDPFPQAAGVSYDLEALTNGDIQPVADLGGSYGKIFDQSAPVNRRIAYEAYSYRTWMYRVISTTSGVTQTTGSVKLGGDAQSQSLVIRNLPPDSYKVEFYDTSAERNVVPGRDSFTMARIVDTYKIWIDAQTARNAAYNMIMRQNQIIDTHDGKVVEDISGDETVDMRAVRVYEQVQGDVGNPDLPGGGIAKASYRNLTLVGITGALNTLRPIDGPDFFVQLHCFCREGIYVKQQLQNMELGPSNVYSDLVLYLFEQGEMLKTEQIDYQALLYAARFCEQYKLHFNGVLNTTNSAAEWLTRTAPYFLCSPRQVDGKHGLTPVVPIDAQYKVSQDPVTPVMTLTTDDISEGSYSRSYINSHDRRPVCLVMLYRQQVESGPGQPRTIEVRYPGTAQEGPYETHDMTEFCVSSTHAAYAARYILAKKRYVEHTVELSIGRRGNMLRPGDIVQIDLALDTTEGDGIVDSTMYEIEQIGEGIGGQVNLTLIHFPVDDSGVSLIAKDIAAGEVEIS